MGEEAGEEADGEEGEDGAEEQKRDGDGGEPLSVGEENGGVVEEEPEGDPGA